MPDKKKLSIIIPVYNEAGTLVRVLDRVLGVSLQFDINREIIIVDDASTDGSGEVAVQYIKAHREADIRLMHHQKNTGKGGCIHSGIALATGDFILIQDADLEYDPRDYSILLEPLMEDKADAVYGSRFVSDRPHRILFFWHSIGNKILTFLSNMLTNLNLTDMESGYKVFRASILKSLPLHEKRFGFEPEVTARIARVPGIRIYEVGIAYYGRTYAEGKKINWKDGLRAIYAILKYNIFHRDKKKAVEAPGEKLAAFRAAYGVTALFFIAGLILIFTASGTGDEGDSLMHYLYARHAYEYPQHFFNHWAKPVFVFAAAPLAQLGFAGMKLFNLLCTTATLLLTFHMGRALRLSRSWVAVICTVFAPALLVVTLSGLTEPLFALWMMTGFYALAKKKTTAAFLWLSFLPFVRSEGLIILCIVILYALAEKKGRLIPLLFTGHLFYALLGMLFGKEFLWVFTEMSYATWHSAYGSGPWFHFVNRLPEVIGLVIPVFLFLGLIYGFLKLIARFVFGQSHSISNEELFLVYGSFLAFFIGHSAFWALGVFNSFGLLRVLICVLPLAGLICARGIQLLSLPVERWFGTRAIVWLSIIAIVVFPVSNTTHAWSWNRHFSLKADQLAEKALTDYIKENFSDYRKSQFFYEPPYLSILLGINHFDTSKRKRLYDGWREGNFPQNSFVIWDDWFAVVEAKVPLDTLMNDGRFSFIKGYEAPDYWNNIRSVKLFRVNGSQRAFRNGSE